MEQYIPKSVLVAEIEKRITEGEKVLKEVPSSAILGLIQAYKNTLSFIDSLPEEPVSEDLKAASYDYVKSNHKDIASIDDCALLYDAIEFGAKWKEEQMMKNAIVMQAQTQDGELWGDIRKFNIEDGDKVKVIIIK